MSSPDDSEKETVSHNSRLFSEGRCIPLFTYYLLLANRITDFPGGLRGCC